MKTTLASSIISHDRTYPDLADNMLGNPRSTERQRQVVLNLQTWLHLAQLSGLNSIRPAAVHLASEIGNWGRGATELR